MREGKWGSCDSGDIMGEIGPLYTMRMGMASKIVMLMHTPLKGGMI